MPHMIPMCVLWCSAVVSQDLTNAVVVDSTSLFSSTGGEEV